MNKLEELLKAFGKNYTIKVGFPKDKQVTYPEGSDRKDVEKEPRKKKDGTPWKTREKTKENPIRTVAQVARWNEFGTKTKKDTWHTVPRPFLRTALRNNRDKIKKLVKAMFNKANINDPNRFHKLGILLVQMVQDSIENGDWAPNKPYTVYRKLTLDAKRAFGKNDAKSKALVEKEIKSMKPLIDTGLMKNSVNYEIVES